MSAIRAALGVASLVSTYVAALIGALAAMVVGPPLAMGLRMMGGDTEPSAPHLPYPHVAFFVGLLLPVPFLRKRSWSLASVAAIPVALLPLWQLWRLYVAAAPR